MADWSRTVANRGGWRRGGEVVPEDPGEETGDVRMWKAVVARAIRDFTQGIGEGFQTVDVRTLAGTPRWPNYVVYKSARDWIFSYDTGVHSFVWVCQMIGRDPARTKKVILKLKPEVAKLRIGQPGPTATDLEKWFADAC